MESYLELGFLVGSQFISPVEGSPEPGKIRHKYLRKEKGRGREWKMERSKGRRKEGDKRSRNNFLQLILSATVEATPNRKLSFLPGFSSE